MSKEAVDRLYEKAQNEQTAIALNDLCRTQRDRIAELERQNGELRKTLECAKGSQAEAIIAAALAQAKTADKGEA